MGRKAKLRKTRSIPLPGLTPQKTKVLFPFNVDVEEVIREFVSRVDADPALWNKAEKILFEAKGTAILSIYPSYDSFGYAALDIVAIELHSFLRGVDEQHNATGQRYRNLLKRICEMNIEGTPCLPICFVSAPVWNPYRYKCPDEHEIQLCGIPRPSGDIGDKVLIIKP